MPETASDIASLVLDALEGEGRSFRIELRIEKPAQIEPDLWACHTQLNGLYERLPPVKVGIPSRRSAWRWDWCGSCWLDSWKTVVVCCFQNQGRTYPCMPTSQKSSAASANSHYASSRVQIFLAHFVVLLLGDRLVREAFRFDLAGQRPTKE